MVDAGSCLGWDTTLFFWDIEEEDGVRGIVSGMNYVQETKDMISCFIKVYMMEYSGHRFMLRFILVIHSSRSWYDSHILIHLVIPRFMMFQACDEIRNQNKQCMEDNVVVMIWTLNRIVYLCLVFRLSIGFGERILQDAILDFFWYRRLGFRC